MAKTQVPSGYIEDDAITSAKIADNTIQVGHLHSSHGITTNNIGEHTNNKYYTDARVDTRLAASKSSNFVTTGNIRITSDSGVVSVGAGNDLRLTHNGTNSFITNVAGNLVLRQEVDDKDIIFQADDGSGGLAQYFRVDGGQEHVLFSKPIKLTDNTKIQIGTDNDLEIYHSGTDSFIDESGTGKLFIRSNEIRLNKYTGEFMIRAIADGAVTLYHDNTARINTTSSGVNVTGALTASGIATVGNIDIPANGTNDTRIEIGTGSSSNHNAYIDLRGDATYTDYGLRLIRFNTGANANSQLVHRGTGTLFVEAADAASVILKTNGTDAVTVDSSQNVTIAGNLTVSGSQTILNTATLDVEDKNITLNKGSGDTSSTADGAGITIQDAVDASTDASLTWRASDDKFIFSHPLRMFGQFELPDNVKMVAGDGNDLQIYHNGSNSYIDDTGTGALNIRSSGIYLEKANGAEVMASFIADGAATLYHDGSPKLETKSTGIAVTGNIAAESGHIEAGNLTTARHLRAYYSDGAYMTLQGYGLEMNRSASYIRPTTDADKTLYIGGADAALDWSAIYFRSANGLYMTGTKFLDTNRNLTNIGTISSGAITTSGTLTVDAGSSGMIDFGDVTSAYGRLYADSTGTYIGSKSNHNLIFRSNHTTALTIDTSQNATFAGDITSGSIVSSGNGFFNGTKLEGDSKEMIRFSDTWLRLNPANEFTDGIYCGDGLLRTDGHFQVGSSGAKFSVNGSTGNVTVAGTIAGNNTISTSIGTTNIGVDITGTSSSYTSAAIKNTGSGDAILWMDASNGDLSGSDYASIRQNNSLEIVIRTEASAAGISLQTQGAQRFRVSSGGTLERGSSNTATLTQAGALTVATGTFTGNVQHTGLTMTSGTDIDQLITATDSLTLSDAWQDTSIAGSDLASGTYIVQVYVNDNGVGGGHYQEFYSGVMSWTASSTNSSEVDEIILHRAGHAPNAGDIYLRTERRYQSGDVGTLMLQIRGSTTNSGASNYIFKFRRMI